MSNSCNKTPTLSNTAKIVKNIGWVKNTPLQWSKFGRQLVLTSQSAEVLKISKI